MLNGNRQMLEDGVSDRLSINFTTRSVTGAKGTALFLRNSLLSNYTLKQCLTHEFILISILVARHSANFIELGSWSMPLSGSNAGVADAVSAPN